MANFLICSIVFRIVLPVIFLSCIIFRPCLISAVYLLLLLISASVPVPTRASLSGATGIYLKLLILISTLMLSLQVVFQSLMLLEFKPYGSILKNCEFLERILRHAGFVRLDHMDALNTITWVTPEVTMFVSSIVFYVVLGRLAKPPIPADPEEDIGSRPIVTTDGDVRVKKQNHKIFIALGKYLVIVALCIAAIMKPSVPGGFYFLVFLCSATWWSCYKSLDKGFAVVMKFCMLVVFCHIFTLYAYQTDWPQEFIGSNSTYSRYFGLSPPLLTIDCKHPRYFINTNSSWSDYVNLLALLFLYFVLAIESSQLLRPQPPKKQGTFSRLEGSFNRGPLSRQLSQRLSDRRLRRSATSRGRWQSATRKVRDIDATNNGALSETTPLIHNVGSPQRYGINVKGPAILQDSTGSVIVAGEHADEIPLKEVNNHVFTEEEPPTCFEQFVYVLESILIFVIRTSYIGTNIIMMAWSITYHSWLTFVLLIWASILWLIPNQRKHMLRSSPFLVIYAWFLLVSAYAYSMNLTEEELPTIVDGIDLKQIGFVRIIDMPCGALLVKCLYTGMFWITLRQFMKENREARQSSALADMVAPLQITVGTATGVDPKSRFLAEGQKYAQKVYPERAAAVYAASEQDFTDSTKPPSSGVSNEQAKDDETLVKIGTFVRKLLTKCWIWIVAITLFIVAITGQRMTSFRILYMLLFLIFILSFQFSFRFWRKMMFGFWLTVIIYSLIILVLIYTYQFDNFPTYWKDYLHVSEQQQLDIGLEKYETKQLFVRLVTPTFFVIITVVQLHYFHKDFLEISKPTQPNVADTTKSEANSSAQGGVKLDDDQSELADEEYDSERMDLTDLDSVPRIVVKKKLERFFHGLYEVFNLILLFLEIHMPKLVLLAIMLVCVKDVGAVYFAVVILIVLGATIGKNILSAVIYSSSLIAAILLIIRMIYQIEYIKHDMWNVTCLLDINNTYINVTSNDAEWLGLYKIDSERKLPELVKWNIIHILAVTFWCVLNVRQSNHRAALGQSPRRPFFIFPNIKITNANKNLKTYMKYLANFLFYRMGVEMCMIAIVAVIGIRMDFYALLYGIWLCILFPMSRTTLAKVWNVFLIFVAVLIPIQYLNVVGMPPILCLSYPWDSNDILRRLQEWAFLMDPVSPPPAKKLLCDFILLLFIARQSLVFRIERRHDGEDYIGGSNDSTIHHAEDKNFTIPVPDFITYSRNYLDIVKKGTLLPCMWLTLAIVFLAGTNRVNLFSLGYLFGSFYFLWKGSDIYLRPIPKIIEQWNMLLGYNVFVIIVKVMLQLVGCLFIDYIKDDACWLVQLLGISCLRKFKTSQDLSIPIPGKDECTVPREYVGLAWDGLCFTFLLLQRRLFYSYNFFHIINESKASAILASRGAELIEELRQKRMSEQDEAERKVIEKIKTKMDRIKATQQKILGPTYKDTTSHYVDQPPLARTSSMSSCTSATSQQTTTPAGYHTPIEEDPEPEPPRTPAASSLMQPNAPSPISAINTELEGYLEPQRMSFSSPPNSELNPNRPPSPDDSFPVFSPPPYDDACTAGSEPTTVVQRQHSIGPPWRAGSLVTPRQSVISYSSRSPMSHHTYSIFPKSNRPMYRRREAKSYKSAIRSGDYYMFDHMDQEDDLDVFEDVSAKTDSDDDDELRKLGRQRTVSELLSSTLKTDMGSVLRERYAPQRRVSLPTKGEAAESQLSAPYSAPPAVPIDETSEYEPQPSTSKTDEPEERKSTLPDKRVSKSQSIVNLLLFVGAFINSVMISATNHLNTYTRDYRYVMRVLSKEKKVLKETTEYNVGTRTGPDFVWQPSASYTTLLQQSREGSVLDTPLVGTCSPSDSYRQALYEPHSRMTEIFSSNSEKHPADSDESCTKVAAAATSLPYASERDRPRASISNIPEIRILAPSMERGLDSPGSTHQVNFIKEFEGMEMSSYDQPAVVRLLLASWYMILSHSDLLCYFIIFLNQIKNATFISLPLPLMVFFWGTLTVPRPSKTFWITIIAYTQIIVIIKCMFQFQILPWNRGDYASYPFQATSLIGIERKRNYAVWDLLLLLVVFFHRFMLKCLGLWKTTIIPVAVLAEGEYSIENGELIPHFAERQKQRDTRRSSDLEQLVDDESDSDEKVYLQSSHIEPNIPSAIKLTLDKHGESLKLFFKQLFDPTSRVAADVYSYMFLCDFFNFFVVMIGYSSFGTQQGDVSSYLEDNRVPVLFLLMLIIQFLIIIIDRAIFLRKNIFAKIIFQFFQIFGLHIWLFVLFPIITERSVNSVVPPQTYYMIKCFYLLLSAYQIRCGYPARILGNFLCKGYNYFNMFSFKAFMMVPFLFELRTVMDWMWTDTSMTVFDWIKMEDIFAHIYQLKCTRHIEDEYPQPRGLRKKPLIKYFMGGGLLTVIIGIIWFPLVFFSLGKAVGEANPPYDVTIDLRLGPYEPLYRMSAQSNSIYKFTENDYLSLQQIYLKDKVASTFISNYDYDDIAAVKLSRYSGTVWSISPPDKKRMIDEVASDNKLLLHMRYQVSHKSNSKEDPGVMWQEIVLEIDAEVDSKPNPIRQNLLAMLNHTEPPPPPILLTYIMPKFAKVTSRGTVQAITQLLDPYPDPKAASLRNVTLNLSEKDENSWWEIQEECDDVNYMNLLKYLPYADCGSFMMYTFNDKIFPATLSIITGGGIIGLYTTLVFVASRVLRGFFSEICFKIMFDDMPNVDRVYQLVLDVYLVREASEFSLEEDLFAKLVFLYRSPETLIKWTRPKEELGEDEDPEGDPDHH